LDLVISNIPIGSRQGLHTCIAQEIQFWEYSTSKELDKVMMITKSLGLSHFIDAHRSTTRLTYMYCVISQMPIGALQGLQTCIVQEIQFPAYSTLKDLDKVMTNKEEMKKDYTKNLEEKEKVEKKVEGMLKEKEEAEKQVERIQRVVHKLYKDIPKVWIVVEATLEEYVQNINEFIQGFHTESRSCKCKLHQGHHLRRRNKFK
jgi:hypothetical protein